MQSNKRPWGPILVFAGLATAIFGGVAIQMSSGLDGLGYGVFLWGGAFWYVVGLIVSAFEYRRLSKAIRIIILLTVILCIGGFILAAQGPNYAACDNVTDPTPITDPNYHPGDNQFNCEKQALENYHGIFSK